MNFVTIASESWIDTHLRWFCDTWQQYHTTSADRLYVIIATDRETCAVPAWLEFATVKVVHAPDPQDMLWYDLMRLRVCEIFGLPDCLYVDPDVDFCKHVPPVPTGPCRILAAENPAMPGTVNNGMLYIRADFDWARAADMMKAWIAANTVTDGRNIGLAAFASIAANLDCGFLFREMTAMWWEDQDRLANVATIHYCNDKGKAARFAKHPRRITLLGMGRTAQERRIDIAQHIIGEAWTLNDGYIPYRHIWPRIARVYELHAWDYLRTFKPRGVVEELDHCAELARLPNATIVSMQPLPAVPRQMLYPWREVMRHLKSRYFLGSPTLILMHALWEHDNGAKIEEIRTFGFDHADGAHEQQRHPWVYWMRAAQERGIRLSGTALDFLAERDNDAGLEWLHRAAGGLEL